MLHVDSRLRPHGLLMALLLCRALPFCQHSPFADFRSVTFSPCLLQHLDKTPNEYIQWRYAIGEDRESLSKTHRQATEEEEKLMAKQHVIDGQKRVVEKILSRRKLKNSYEYEVRFVNGTPDDDVWMKRTE